FHHAGYDYGSGFCTFNGLALVAQQHPHRRVFVLDCDQHGGNGTAEMTERLPNLFNFTIFGLRFGCQDFPRSISRHIPRDTGHFGMYREALEEGFRLEASGWKGEQGTAIACAPQTRSFYTALAKVAAEQRWLSLYFLKVGGRTVAFHFGLQVGGRYFLLKPGYDESLGECSPGQLLVDEVLRDLFHRGAHELDFLGPRMTWKLDWTQRLRPHCWLFVLRPTLKGRALHAARFRLGPRAARWVRGVVRWKQ
ncbi:MAG TPA: GNAT family N-acetyltransferase, partial [Myxococcales bacterium]|nr:GNAT family N-acetyltransferase [Myxococcales bacterium]